MGTMTPQTKADKLADLDRREQELRVRLRTKLPAPIRRFALMALEHIRLERIRVEGGQV
jgi:hypothetical protein